MNKYSVNELSFEHQIIFGEMNNNDQSQMQNNIYIIHL